MSTRQQILDTLDTPIDGRPARLLGADTITPETAAVAVWQNHMDFHAYTHLHGAGSVNEAFDHLNALRSADEDDDIVVVGVLDFNAADVRSALITPSLAPGRRVGVDHLHLSD
jgi:hypothetical protein